MFRRLFMMLGLLLVIAAGVRVYQESKVSGCGLEPESACASLEGLKNGN